MNDWIAQLREVLSEESQAMVVTVAATRGSVPREAGTRMIVGARSLHGTIGGGHLEFDAIRIARGALDANESGGNWLVRFPLAARLGQCCGGVATLLFQRVSAVAEWPAELMRRRDAGDAVALVVGVGTRLPRAGDRDAACEPGWRGPSRHRTRCHAQIAASRGRPRARNPTSA